MSIFFLFISFMCVIMVLNSYMTAGERRKNVVSRHDSIVEGERNNWIKYSC